MSLPTQISQAGTWSACADFLDSDVEIKSKRERTLKYIFEVNSSKTCGFSFTQLIHHQSFLNTFLQSMILFFLIDFFGFLRYDTNVSSSNITTAYQ